MVPPRQKRGQMKFIVTQELGRLAKWLRILGCDTLYFESGNRSSLIITALREERIILTRDLRVGRHPGMKMVTIKSDFIKDQLKQVLEELGIHPIEEEMFSRCVICNERLAEIEKQKVKDRVPEYVFQTQDNFVTCPSCSRIYWQGTHWGNVSKMLGEIFGK
jgi:hypothetical protein